jgi:hypothetical protein
VRILNFNEHRATEKVISGDLFSDHDLDASQARDHLGVDHLKSIQVYSYAHDIVILLCDFGLRDSHIFAVNISDTFLKTTSLSAGSRSRSRVLLKAHLRSTNRLFVRHNGQYLVAGTYSGSTDSDDRLEWQLHRYSLSTAESLTKEPLQLHNFYGSELGSTVCFTIHQDKFYGLTSQTTDESEEVDWTGYYQFVSFDVSDPHPDPGILQIWRRQHLEGPIHDAWTDIGFQEDHRTGELLIVECRKEWTDGGSRSIRTYYTQPFHRAHHSDPNVGRTHPPDDPLSRTLDDKSNSKWEEPHPRTEKYVHTESPKTGSQDGIKEYIRAKTKWNGYSFNAQSFVDLVTDEVTVEGSWRRKERIKVRVVSRDELNPLVPDDRSAGGRGTTPMVVRPRTRDREGEEMQDGEEAFSPSRVFLWPPDDAPEALHDILCPGGRAGDVQAVLGDEGIVYMIGPPREPLSRERALVFVSFDPTFGFKGMKRLDGSLALPKPEYANFGSVDVADTVTSGKGRERKRKSVSIAPSKVMGSGASVKEKDTETPMKNKDHMPVADVFFSTTADLPKRLKGDHRETAGSGLVKNVSTGGLTSNATVTTTSTTSLRTTVAAVDPGQRQARGAIGESPAAVPHTALTQWPPTPDSATPKIPRLSPLSPSPPPSPEARLVSRLSQCPSPGGKQQVLSPQRHQQQKQPPSTPKRLTWREKAAYISIGKGYWLR